MAEPVERRVVTERNCGDKPVTVTQSAGETDCGLARIRAAVEKDSQLQFNNLYHHLTYQRLLEAYYDLKPPVFFKRVVA